MTPRHGNRIRNGGLFGAAEKRSRILMVDDEQTCRDYLHLVLQNAGLENLVVVATAAQAIESFDRIAPDLVIVDLHLPDIHGIDLLSVLQSRLGADDYLPFLVVTGDATDRAREEALGAGAKDFITKPFDANEVLLRVRNLLETRVMHLALRRQRNVLVEQFEARSRELEDARIEILERLARVAEHRDDGAFGHIRRVGELAGLIAEELGCDRELCEQIRRAAPLHDVGKIGIRDDILLKAGPLAPCEFEIQEKHTVIGAQILSGGGFPVLRLAEQIALTHHERWDGKGYPRGIFRDAIPLPGRIVAVADCFDALVHPRPYKAAWKVDEAIEELQREAGRKFDPTVVNAMIRVVAAGLADRVIEKVPAIEDRRLARLTA